MKKIILIAPFFMMALHVSAQSKSITKSIEIEDDGSNPVVKIKTTENGKTTEETLTGDAAADFIAKHESADFDKEFEKSIIDIRISRRDIEEMERELKMVGIEINKELKEGLAKTEQMNIDSILNSIGVQIEQSVQQFKFEYSNDGVDKKSTVVIHSDDQSEGEQKDVEVEVKEVNGALSKMVIVKHQSISIEDLPQESERPVKAELEIFPNPALDQITINLKSKNDEAVSISIFNSVGESIYNASLVGKGEKTLSISTAEFTPGTYSIEAAQGDKKTLKKLVIR